MRNLSRTLMQSVNAPKLIIGFGLAIFLIINVFGLVLSSSMQFHISTQQCATNQQGQCNNVWQHVSSWQSDFVASVPHDSLLFLFGVIALAFLTITDRSNSKRWLSKLYCNSNLSYAQGRLHNFLLHALSLSNRHK